MLGTPVATDGGAWLVMGTASCGAHQWKVKLCKVALLALMVNWQ
jgi:hypothetical protein